MTAAVPDLGPPTLARPHKGGGDGGFGGPATPSPSMGEGRGGGGALPKAGEA